MKVYRITVGIGEDRFGKPINPRTVADNKHTACTTLAIEYGGYTIYEAEGGWVGDKGQLIEEPVLIFEFADKGRSAPDRTARTIAERFRDLFVQDSVLFAIIDGYAELI